MQQILTGRKALLRLVVLIGFVCVIPIWQSRLPNRVFAQADCPTMPVVTIDSPQTPPDICVPDGFAGNPIQYFDDYSWRAFISMVWPAMAGQRGVPDPAKHIGDISSPLLFETYKSDWELFLPSGAAPSQWGDHAGPNPCGPNIPPDDMVLAAYSKFGNFGQAGSSKKTPFLHALPSQNGKWVRYLTGFNEVEYTQIVKGRLYLLSVLNHAGSIAFQSGAIDVKSAWMDLAGLSNAQQSRYIKRTAWVTDPNQPANPCSVISVGLIGLHIVQKTASRPQWVWSTFEQIDNAPSAGPFGLSGNVSPITATPPVDPNGGFPPDWKNPKPYNVVRVKPIHLSTQETNAKYQQALAGVQPGNPLQFYQLVMTQWPLQLNPPNPIPASQTGQPANTFPGTKAPTTSFANTALETWEQNNIFTSCMACHDNTRVATDFLWTLEINAFDDTIPSNAHILSPATKTVRPPRSEAERRLLELLKSTVTNKHQ
jgi:hypothetical protein